MIAAGWTFIYVCSWNSRKGSLQNPLQNARITQRAAARFSCISVLSMLRALQQYFLLTLSFTSPAARTPELRPEAMALDHTLGPSWSKGQEERKGQTRRARKTRCPWKSNILGVFCLTYKVLYGKD